MNYDFNQYSLFNSKISKLVGITSVYLFLFFSFGCHAQVDPRWLVFEGKSGPGKGKHIVLVSGDDEYRSEETMPMLGKLLAQHYGFKCTVLFPIDPNTGDIVPSYQNNIPGLENLKDADIMIMLTRFRELPDSQSQHIQDFILEGKPLIGLRTSTHAFHYEKDLDSPFLKWNWQNKDDDWKGGFGQQIFGETWVAHHGEHGKEGARALLEGLQSEHPILKGVKNIWVASDVYTVKNLTSDANVLLHGIPTKGMEAHSPINWQKSLMPLAWTKAYQIEGGKKGKAFTTTMGASVDFQSEDLRRLVVNAVFWGLDMPDKISEDMKVDFIGDYEPTMFGFDTFRKGMRVEDFK